MLAKEQKTRYTVVLRKKGRDREESGHSSLFMKFQQYRQLQAAVCDKESDHGKKM